MHSKSNVHLKNLQYLVEPFKILQKCCRNHSLESIKCCQSMCSFKDWESFQSCFLLFRRIFKHFPVFLNLKFYKCYIMTFLSLNSFSSLEEFEESLILSFYHLKLFSSCSDRVQSCSYPHSKLDKYTNTVKWNRHFVCLWYKMSTFQTVFCHLKMLACPWPLLCSIPREGAFKWGTIWHSTSRGVRFKRILNQNCFFK